MRVIPNTYVIDTDYSHEQNAPVSMKDRAKYTNLQRKYTKDAPEAHDVCHFEELVCDVFLSFYCDILNGFIDSGSAKGRKA